MQFLLAILPIVLLITLIVVFRRSVITAAASSLALLLVLVVWWGMDSASIVSAGVRGVLLSSEIAVIVFGALLIVELLRRRGLFEPVRAALAQISTDYRVQAIMVAFGLVYFIEGAAGFGTPAIVAVPLLMALGFKPLHAVVLSLIGDSIPVSFGAVGLPITYGIETVIQPLTSDSAAITDHVIHTVAALNVIASTVLAAVIAGVAVNLRRSGWRAWLEFLPFTLVSALAVAVPAYLVAIFIGPELPSIVGGLIGLFLIGILARRGIALPASARPTVEPNSHPVANHAIWQALAPYLILIGLLVLTRLPHVPFGSWLRRIQLDTGSILGTEISYSIAPLYSAATILLFTALFTLFVSWRHIENPAQVVTAVLTKIKRPFIALLLVLVFVQLFIFSGEGSTAASMPVTIAETISRWSGGFWPFIAPLIGALGSFVAGSTTVSNLIFSGLQYDIALSLDLDPVRLLALQTIGASIGNMVALHNIIAALTIAGLTESRSHEVIRANLWPLAILLGAVGTLGLLIT